MYDIPCNSTCYDCALHCSHKGGFCKSKDVKHPCSFIKDNYSSYKEYLENKKKK